jgi:hypothetical protein
VPVLKYCMGIICTGMWRDVNTLRARLVLCISAKAS